MPEKGFLIFLLFFRNFFPRLSLNGNRDKIVFSLFFGLSTPVLAKNNSGNRFFDFSNFFFFIFFWNFLSRVVYERKLGLKFFSLFLNFTQTVLGRKNAGSNFFKFFNFFAIFFGIFLLRLGTNRIRD